MKNESISAQEIIEIIKSVLEKDKRIKVCHKFQTDKSLQIQLNNGDAFNLVAIKLDEKAYRIQRLNNFPNHI